MIRRWIIVMLIALATAACVDHAKRTTGCNQTPPPSELEEVSEMLLTLEPNPVRAGESAVLSVELGGRVAPGDAVSYGVTWECWNGDGWIVIYQVLRYQDGVADFLPAQPGSVTTIIASRLPVPNEEEIVIPPVPPGIYRIRDRALDADVLGFVFVEVVEP